MLTLNEYEAILSHSEGHLKDILIMGYWTGMRKGEIINLKWDRVDLKTRMIHLKAEDTKEGKRTGKGKSIPISKDVYKVLTRDNRHIRSIETDNHVFLYNGRSIKQRFETALKTACDRAGIQWGRNQENGFIFHDLRHTFVTDMRKAGVSKSVRMSITGHSIRDMDDRYNKIDNADKHEAIRKLEAFRNVDHSVDQAHRQKAKTLQNQTFAGYKMAEVHGNRTHLTRF